MPKANSKQELWDRRVQVIRLRAKGIGPYEIAKQFNVDPHVIYNDMEAYHKAVQTFEGANFAVSRILNQFDEVIRLCWQELKNVEPGERAPLIARMNEAVGNKMRALGLDKPSVADAARVVNVIHAYRDRSNAGRGKDRAIRNGREGRAEPAARESA